MNTDLVSIVMPVKNTSAFLEECLDSICNQSYLHWELISVNDHSTDDSLEILNRYSQKDPRIKVYTNRGQGIIPALQLAHTHTQGKYITRMDSDDIMLPVKLESMKLNLDKYGPGHLACGKVKYFADYEIGDGFSRYESWLNTLIANGNNFTERYKECVVPSPSWMCYLEDFEKCGAFNPDMYPEDYELVFRFHELGLKCIPSSETVHLWRDYQTRTSRVDEHYADQSFLNLKMKYFFKLDQDLSKEILIWGAGKKGKKLASLLQSSNVPFTWACNNPNKIGKDIFGKILLSISAITEFEKYQSIITVANTDAQEEIKKSFAALNLKPNKDYFLFC